MNNRKFNIEIKKNCLFIESLSYNWTVDDIHEDLADMDILWLTCEDENREYLVYKYKDVYLAKHYKFDFLRELMKKGYTCIDKSSYNVDQYIKKGHKCFLEITED